MTTDKDIHYQGFSSNSEFETSLQHGNEKASPVLYSQDEILSKEELSDEHVQEKKYTMQSLCRSFLKKYANTHLMIEPTLIAMEFNAKLRRVYDLTNILEGGGIIQKVEKGIYKWKGPSKNKQLPITMLKNDWCSLRNISFEIKSLFNQMKKGLTCNDLYSVLTEGNKNRFNPSTIRRKIYQCCKVFVIAGLIQKSGKFFYSSKMTQNDIRSLAKLKFQQEMIHQANNVDLMKPQSGQHKIFQKLDEAIENSKDCQKNYPLNLQQRQAIIRKIVNEFQNESDLNKFIQDLSQEYRSKKIIPFVSVKQQPIYDEKMEKVSFQQYQQYIYQGSPQMQRNIIISSPVKDEYPQFFNLNSSCWSFSSEGVYSSFEPIRDIKGK